MVRGRDGDVVTNAQEPHRKDLESRAPKLWEKVDRMYKCKQIAKEDDKAMTKTNVHYRKLTSVKT